MVSGAEPRLKPENETGFEQSVRTFLFLSTIRRATQWTPRLGNAEIVTQVLGTKCWHCLGNNGNLNVRLEFTLCC